MPGSPANVYVQPFPATGYREQISATSGGNPVWSPDGRQVGFNGPENGIYLADVIPAGNTLRVGSPRLLFKQRLATGGGLVIDGQSERFLVVSVDSGLDNDESAKPLTVIVNWLSTLTVKK